MGSYELFECLATAAIFVIGLIMFLAPQKSTKKEMRDDEKAVKSTKRSGLILMIVGIIATVAMVAFNLKY